MLRYDENMVEPTPEIVSQPETALALSDASASPSNLIMVVHASVGSGHRSAANSIAQALELLRDEHHIMAPSDLEIEVIDILDWGFHKFNGDRTASLFTGATRPFYDLTWRYAFTGRILWGGGTIWSRLMFKPFTAYVAEKRPLAIIATHIVGANAAVAARMLTDQNFPIVSVPTDYETEGLWPHRYTDLFCVATESMAETLRARRIEDERIQITGIPAREDFRRTYNRDLMCEKFDLPRDKRIILALAGAHLPRPYQHFREALDHLLPYCHTLDGLHFVLIAGRDEDYQKHLEHKCEEHGLENVTVFGYVDEMAALMAASDLVVCKSGGLTVTECLYSQTPMILVGRAYGQEKVNVEMLTARSAAMHVTTWRELLNALRYIMNDPESINAMLYNARALRRPNAARDIAEATLKLAEEQETAIVPQSMANPQRKKRFFCVYWGNRPAHVR